MKYLNQINTLVGVAGLLVVVYTFSVTFFEGNPVRPVAVSVERATPPPMNPEPGSITTSFGAATTPQSALGTVRSPASPRTVSQGRTSNNTTSPRRRPSAPPTRRDAGPGTPTWQGAADPIVNAAGGIMPGASADRPGPSQGASRPTTRPPASRSQSTPARAISPGSTTIERSPSGRAVARPRPQPPAGAESQKRDFATDPNSPPVRSSLPESRPPQ